MKKLLLIFGLLSIESLQAQAQSAPTRPDGRTHVQHRNAQKRIGINTEKPVASLEIAKVSNVPATQVQGFLLPHLTQDERNAMEEAALVNGLMIFNTSKNCIEWWDGSHWLCIGSSGSDRHGDPYTRLHAWYVSEQSYTGNASFTRDNCPVGQIGGSVVYSATVQARGESRKSEEDARSKALDAARTKYYQQGQEYANANGTCNGTATVYTSRKRESYSEVFNQTNCPSGFIPDPYTHTESASMTRTSAVSQADADRLASEAAREEARRLVRQNGQQKANTRKCTLNYPKTCRIEYTYKVLTNDGGVANAIGPNVSFTGKGEYTKTLNSYSDLYDFASNAEFKAKIEASDETYRRYGHRSINTFEWSWPVDTCNIARWQWPNR